MAFASTWIARTGLAALLSGALVVGNAFADEPAAEANPAPDAPVAAPPADPLAGLASSDDVAAALAKFKEEFAARGLKGDDKLMQQEHALENLGRTVHPQVADRLFEAARRERLLETRRMALTAMRLAPGLAAYTGPKIVQLLEDKRLAKEDGHKMACMRVMGQLGYLPPLDVVERLVNDKDYTVRKQVFEMIGALKDARMLEKMLDMLGMTDEAEAGDSWDGAEANVDTGTAGDGDQKAAEAKAKAEAAGNRTGARTQRMGASVARDIRGAILESLKAMTGQDFVARADASAWLAENPTWQATALAATEAELARQTAAAAALRTAKK